MAPPAGTALAPLRGVPSAERPSHTVSEVDCLVAYSGTLSRKKGQQSIDLVRRKPVRHISGMNRQTRTPSAFSKVSVKSQTVIPREVRERLQLNPGDTLRYRLTGEGVLLDKAPASDADDPFVAFSEWSGEADEKAYGDL